MTAKKNRTHRFQQKTFKEKDEKYTITLNDKMIEEKTNIKNLGVVLDQFLTFQYEIKKILRKMACGIKTLQ